MNARASFRPESEEPVEGDADTPLADAPIELVFPDGVQGSSTLAGESVAEGRGRVFPCQQCGADVVFSIGQQQLVCPYCNAVQELVPAEEGELVERDYRDMLERIAQWKQQRAEQRKNAETTAEAINQSQAEEDDPSTPHAVSCSSCGGEVVFVGSLTSGKCPYCASPLQRDDVHLAPKRVPVDGVMPFLVPVERASENLKRWIGSLWFAPTDFQRQGATGKFNGVYLPYFTFDSLTYTVWQGQRGDHYYVTTGTGKNQRRVRRTRWSSRSGNWRRPFDDVLVVASTALTGSLAVQLEPWPLGQCRPFNPQLLAGLLARTYDTPLENCFEIADQRMGEVIYRDICREIGGDEQRVTNRSTKHSAVTFKHLLLPVWLMAYRYRDTPYQIAINACTGEVVGTRPYSWIKIALAVLGGLMVAGVIALLFKGAQG